MEKWTETLWTVRLEDEGEVDRGTVRGRNSNAPPNVKLALHFPSKSLPVAFATIRFSSVAFATVCLN